MVSQIIKKLFRVFSKYCWFYIGNIFFMLFINVGYKVGNKVGYIFGSHFFIFLLRWRLFFYFFQIYLGSFSNCFWMISELCFLNPFLLFIQNKGCFGFNLFLFCGFSEYRFAVLVLLLHYLLFLYVFFCVLCFIAALFCFVSALLLQYFLFVLFCLYLLLHYLAFFLFLFVLLLQYCFCCF